MATTRTERAQEWLNNCTCQAPIRDDDGNETPGSKCYACMLADDVIALEVQLDSIYARLVAYEEKTYG